MAAHPTFPVEAIHCHWCRARHKVQKSHVDFYNLVTGTCIGTTKFEACVGWKSHVAVKRPWHITMWSAFLKRGRWTDRDPVFDPVWISSRAQNHPEWSNTGSYNLGVGVGVRLGHYKGWKLGVPQGTVLIFSFIEGLYSHSLAKIHWNPLPSLRPDNSTDDTETKFT